jgi:hypothetical protein
MLLPGNAVRRAILNGFVHTGPGVVRHFNHFNVAGMVQFENFRADILAYAAEDTVA